LRAPLAAVGCNLVVNGSLEIALCMAIALFGNVLEAGAAFGAQAGAGSLNPLEEAWIMFQAVLEPLIFALKPYQDPRRFSVPGNDDLFILG